MYNLSLNNIYQEAGLKRKPDESKMLKIETNENEEPEIENASIKKIKFLTFDELFLKYEACQKVILLIKIVYINLIIRPINIGFFSSSLFIFE